ncbi:MAG TPA: N-6 DNA methylase [Thermodesulfovibrionales bacterium]|nr:N-6 DNA methylase [Thermodesulfovibrionales bacterium]
MKNCKYNIPLQENLEFEAVDKAMGSIETSALTLSEEAVSASVNRYKQNGAAKKVLGAVYTPPRVASALVRWAIRSHHDKVLDPSCGDGVFLKAAKEHMIAIGNKKPFCMGVDIDPKAAAESSAICADFFEWALDAPRFDAIVGNPPFIRSHLFPEPSRKVAFHQMGKMGLHPSRLMSTWVPFVAISSKLLTENGRMAFVIPEELLHVSYAEELRRLLLKFFRRVIICVPNGSIFSTVQQSVVLLLCENETSGPAGLLTISFSQLEKGPPYDTDSAPEWDWTPKWTHVFLSADERSFVSKVFSGLGWKPLSEYGRVEVGVVTGDNNFFIVPESKVKKLKADNLFTPIITSARELQGIQFAAQDFKNLARNGNSLFLISTAESLKNLPQSLQEYLSEGIKEGIHQRYKCRIRDPWYAVPSIWPADAILLRQAGEVPRLVHLTRKCTSTDTVHRVRWRKQSLGKLHAASFMNTFTLIACELTGRSYGGGVLELMPSEANNIPLPPPMPLLGAFFDEIDSLARQRHFDKTSELIDQIVVPKTFTRNDLLIARTILAKLITRRKNKKNGHS